MGGIDAKDVLKLITTRRTVRKIDPNKVVKTNQLERILQAGTWAPYGPYYPQGWKEYAREFANTLGNAPVVFVGLVPFDTSLAKRGHNLGSAWAAVQNMMLQATAENLATGVVTFHSPSIEQELVRSLGLVEKEWIVAFVLNVGHALEKPKAEPRKGELYEIQG